MDKVNVFPIGAGGVNTNASPLQVSKDELTKAQNAEYIIQGGEGALDQRPGMSRVNASAMGSGTAMVMAFDVPIKAQSEYTSYLYAGMASGATNNWRRSTDGTTWANDNTPGKPFSTFTSVGYFKDWPKAVTVNYKLYFFDTSTPAVLYEYDGTTARAVCTLPANRVTATNAVGVMDMITDGTYIYVAVIDAVATEPDLPGRVLAIHPLTGSVEQIGAGFGSGLTTNGAPSALCIHNGLLFVGTYTGTTNGNQARIYKRPAQGVLSQTGNLGGWVTDSTLTASQGDVCSMASYKGRLYAGVTSQVAGTAGLVLQRTEESVWSTSRTGPATTAQSGYMSLWTFNSELYAGWADPGTTAGSIDKYDGSSWTADLAIGSTEVVCQAVVFPTSSGSLYVVLGKTSHAGNTASRILKRTTGGTWSTADNESDHYRGPLAILRAA